jgi:hypothetical protein
MSGEPQLPGYSVDDDDDTHDDNAHNDAVTAESERADDSALAASAGDAGASAATVSSPTPLVSTQSRPTLPSEQEEGEGHPTATDAATTPPVPAVDEFADPKISQLHAIFPDYDAAIL